MLASTTVSLAATIDYNLNETPSLPVPSWVQMIDQGERDPRLAGIFTPSAIQVEIVAEQPVVVNPVGITFSDAGDLYVLEWRVAPESKHITYEVTFKDGTKAMVNRMQKNERDDLKLLRDENGDGVYDHADVLMDDLEIPSSMLLHDDWIYLSSLGHVVRRKQSEAGGKFDIEEEIVRGLCGFHHHQASGMTVSPDGWMFISAGDDDNHGEGSDGSRATVLRTGTVMRCRPDGSDLHEFARGFRNPYRDVAFDHQLNMFHIDNDQEDGSKFQGCRLMHIQEGGDFGWRLAQGTVCCRTDFDRGAVFGERPGKMPSMLKTGRGSPAGLLIYQGTKFPESFQGLLIYPDVYRKMVRAYGVKRSGSTFEVTEQFELMRSEDGLFRPCQAIVGPDGAIYICDWRTDSGGAGRLWGDGEHGRIYRLTWKGTAESPALPRGPMNAWAGIAKSSDDALWKDLDTADFELRKRVQKELVRRAKSADVAEQAQYRTKFLKLADDPQRTLPARAMAMGAACQVMSPEVVAGLANLLRDPSFELRRWAAELLGRNTPGALVSDSLLRELAESLTDQEPAPRRSAAIALGALAAKLPEDDPARQHAADVLLAALFEDNGQDAWLHDGYLRGLESIGKPGLQLLVRAARGNDPARRELAIAALESTRTAEAAQAIDAVLQGAEGLDFAQAGRLLETYRHILVEPPISVAAVGEWLNKHPEAPPEVKLVALETLGEAGGTNPEQALPMVIELLAHDDAKLRRGVINVIGDNHLVGAAVALGKALQDPRRDEEEKRAIITALGKLKQQTLPWGNKTAQGVELVVDQLVEFAEDQKQAALLRDVLPVLASVDFAKAAPRARQLLDSKNQDEVAVAVDVLGTNPQQARELAEQFLAGKLDRGLLPQVSGALQRHAEQDKTGEINELLAKVFRGGLLVSLDPSEVKRVEELVAKTGDAARGRELFLDAKKTQCVTCHKLEGTGGQVGPDLSRIWETQTVAKILEAMIDPSKEIKEGFQGYTIVTDSGQVYNGLKVAETPQQVTLRDAQARDITVPRDEIEELAETKKSVMPEGVLAQLNYQQFIDLVAFLKSKEAQESLRAAAP
jgi:putative membrane-bound dehydrogenase-like protein